MSKITFRADDDLVEQLEALEISKSEAMREALRSYLGADSEPRERSVERERTDTTRSGAIDDLIRDRVDELLERRLRDLDLESRREPRPRNTDEVTVTVSLEGDQTRDRRRVDDRTRDREPRSDRHERRKRDNSRGHTGNDGSESHRRDRRQSDHDERKTARTETTADETGPSDDGRTQCGQCGESVSDDHVYCPNCGGKVSRRLFCECGDEVRSDWSFCPGCGRRTPSADVLGSDRPT
ncbi:zinc ribbon domain-containing protein [Natronolimnohabitans sp. A-GB9]|uniref:double zinc ribbon domain-containing protein n=1 Tax=Natronolimnohabitans sp. A-GB9 TaxID=3069757 RepID=UPI0027B27196|nr:zinc ribbon domain-containing protein [Natronolimnohabitans sp. A-GB9]MDQ2051221.1 zinc ribbon domain-containing protein [Natronolimnohabitans sp. A-GB9]